VGNGDPRALARWLLEPAAVPVPGVVVFERPTLVAGDLAGVLA
jgi:hypothetical protein